jgi:glycosyltransferase involved in cell wall biosynthesis
MSPVKVLITTPELTLPGGVTGLFNMLRLDEKEGIEYFSVNFNKGKWSTLLLPIVYLKFLFKVGSFHTVHLNPSMNAKSFYRDMVFAFISTVIFNKKLIVYWHGWQDEFFQKIKSSAINRFAFDKSFGLAEIHFVLANKFADQLKSIDYKGQVLLESNVAEKIAVNELPEKTKVEPWTIVYLSRITRDKGWDIALKTMKILQDRCASDIRLVIAGDGDCLQSAKSLARDLHLGNVTFAGHVQGEEKKKLLLTSDMMFFPTCYPEGMPVVILEGMMCGLPIITREAGGIADHICDVENGFVTQSENPEDFAEFIIALTEDPGLYDRIRQKNIEQSQELYVPARLVTRLVSLYQ